MSDFFSPPSPPDPSDTAFEATANSISKSISTGQIVSIVFAILIFIVVVVVIISCLYGKCWRRRDTDLALNSICTLPHHTASPSPHAGRSSMVQSTPAPAQTHFIDGEAVLIESNSRHADNPQQRCVPPRFGSQDFTYEQLREATNDFSDSELLGRGGSGSVYRGKLPDDGTLVAVKSILENSNQGLKEFNAEVSIISDLRHRNLVKLKGWCHDQGKFLVVYDYMPNGSLDSLLFNDALCVKLNWERRFAAATGLGSALMYLHNECDKVVIHRDVKSSNLLLDESFVAKLGDFGLSRQVDQDATSHITRVAAGTHGYMAPELFDTGKVTRETDMYAFGVVLLEVVTRKRALDASLQEHGGMLVNWVRDLFGQDRGLEIVDKRLGQEWDREEAKRMLVVGLACCHLDAQSRLGIRRAVDVLNGTVVLPCVPPSNKPSTVAPSPPIMSMDQIMALTTLQLTDGIVG